ncbi:hypothetical protein GC105_00715 [Alkalibaculum sp. M08DMB]|uniref:RNA polymerase sigma-70 region 2 domain-containing protein n=1 Tax=Alkalibaculum sporogenes TaxID=2655001 RepID=A0A6A7K4L4_9FIRM|nr:sigma-70 family RNA polymerase sigma factor [Alkalibaculum sporogenes]MPW24315.1 hypothetical protein [Alkalibaculum sporogenes]
MQSNIIEILYNKYYSTAYHYTLSLSCNLHLAEDIVSNAFVKALLTLDDNRVDFKFWLLRVCKNLWIDELRKTKHVTDSSGGELHSIVSSENIENKLILCERNKVKLYSVGVLFIPY